MKLLLQREHLLKPLQMVIGAVDHKQAMPILSNVLLQTHQNQLSLTGTDLEVELIGHSLLPEIETSHVRFLLPARKLMDICKSLPEDAPIELYQEKERMILKSDRSRFVMSTMPADDFPVVKLAPANFTFSMPQGDLLFLLQRTAFAMAEQDVRYYLNGMLLELENAVFRVVATDGHRLAMNQLNNMSIKLSKHVQVIVPYKAVMELTHLLKESEQIVEISVSSHHIRVVTDDFVFTSQLVEGRFPDYQRVIPKKGNTIVEVDRDALKQALMRTAILCNEKVRGVRMELHNGLLRLFTNNQAHEAAEEELDVNYQGELFEAGFNISYLLDILNVAQPGLVRLILTDSAVGMRIEEPGYENTSAFVVMPMRM